MFKIGNVVRLTTSFNITFPATSAWPVKGQKVTIVGEWKDNEEFEPWDQNRIYIVEWSSDAFAGCAGYRFPVRARDLEF